MWCPPNDNLQTSLHILPQSIRKRNVPGSLWCPHTTDVVFVARGHRAIRFLFGSCWRMNSHISFFLFKSSKGLQRQIRLQSICSSASLSKGRLDGIRPLQPWPPRMRCWESDQMLQVSVLWTLPSYLHWTSPMSPLRIRGPPPVCVQLQDSARQHPKLLQPHRFDPRNSQCSIQSRWSRCAVNLK